MANKNIYLHNVKLLLQLVGTGQGIGASEFTVLMRELVNSQLKSFMTEYIISHNINIFDIVSGCVMNRKTFGRPG